MKLYSINYGCYGMSVVVARSIDEAIVFFRNTYNWTESDRNRIQEEDIRVGVLLENLGDR